MEPHGSARENFDVVDIFVLVRWLAALLAR